MGTRDVEGREDGSEGEEREVEEDEKAEGRRGGKGEGTEGRGRGINLPHGLLKTLAALSQHYEYIVCLSCLFHFACVLLTERRRPMTNAELRL